MDYDVIVVGAGNAALAAAVSARNEGAERVLVLEKAPLAVRGGNTHYSGALLRFAFDRPQDLLRLAPDVETQAPGFLSSIKPYPAEAFRRELDDVTQGQTDPRLSQVLISRSYETACWMADQGIRMEGAVSLAAIQFDGRIKWPGGAVIRAVGEGVGLSRMWFAIAERKGCEIRYAAAAQRLLQADGRVNGVEIRDSAGEQVVRARAIVLACGGFEANRAWRALHLKGAWEQAKVRGTRFNTGDGLRMALEAGATRHGQWNGCHGTPIAADSPEFGDRKRTDKTNRLSYPFGILVNTQGLRFVDEGEDFQFLTYAKMGGAILHQPGQLAFQIFDAKVTDLLEPRYATSTPIVGETLEALAEQLPVDREAFLSTLSAYNAAVASQRPFDPTVRDGLSTEGLQPPKSNWAQRIDTPPFRVYAVTGGITFTFGGVHVNEQAQVLGADSSPIPGLYACGEMVGGLFHSNYPGGAGLMSGAVFGRIAGAGAASAAGA